MATEGTDMAGKRGTPELDFPLELEGLLTNPGTREGQGGGEADSTELHAGVQGAGGEAAAGRRQGVVGGGDGTRRQHRSAELVARRGSTPSCAGTAGGIRAGASRG